MPIAPYQHNRKIESITIAPNRQRKELGDLTELKRNIEAIGLLHPIIITREGQLIAGERRLTAYTQLRNEWTGEGRNPYLSIPFRYFDSLDPTELQVCELAENAKRRDMSWQETAASMLRIKRMLAESDRSEAELASQIGLGVHTVRMYVQVGEELEKGNEAVCKATGFIAAHNIIRRAQERAVDDVTSAFIRAMPTQRPATSPQTPAATVSPSDEKVPEAPAAAPQAPATENNNSPIRCENFLTFAPNYTGEPFNFLHCDFPYGINFQSSPGHNTAKDRVRYEDSPDTYWTLLRCLRDNFNALVSDTAHILFWFSMDYYAETKEFFEQLPGCTVNPFPLIWNRSRSNLPDPEQGPRRSYETAFLITRGKRKILRAVHNVVQYNTESKLIHISEKPPAMLKHFYEMLVDESTTLFDPTCGSGASLRAAISFKPRRMLGLELSPDFASAAQSAFEIANLVGSVE